ncbi:hypothetical protein [Micromonospora marina]|uniref:Uncharacterized protein n=1 Tax=Micromonospora marina TaxID=307120 RepID=A0A1C4Y515_9ACTN|nr:hypothetical protein [Micromonospora marina]SCF15794.1 hypothetical protein GA0070215_109171 [Micromonospora marina]
MARTPASGTGCTAPGTDGAGGPARTAASGTNWEGCGVAPDVATPADRARDVAYRRNLEALLAADPDRPAAAEQRTALAALG